MTDALARMNAARIGPHVTCPASRHVAMIADAMIEAGDTHQGESIADTVAALWEARAQLDRAREANAELSAEKQAQAKRFNDDMARQLGELRLLLARNLVMDLGSGEEGAEILGGIGAVIEMVEAYHAGRVLDVEGRE